MNGTLLALSLLSHHLNCDDARNEETQCMLVLTSTHALLLIANNNDTFTKNWTQKFFLRCSGSVLLEESKSRGSFLNPVNGSKALIFNQVKEAFGPYTDERLKHKKFSSEIGYLDLGSDSAHKDSLYDGTCRTILVTGNDSSLKTVSGAVHAEQKLVAALQILENRVHIQSVWVAGCKRACNLCYQALHDFRESRRTSGNSRQQYEFEFESQLLTSCQGNQRTVQYDS